MIVLGSRCLLADVSGYSIEVAVNVIHMDPKIWDKPDEFRPQRFEPEEASKRSPYAFNAFGVGNRNCLGMRLGLIEAKMAITGLLTEYKLSMGKQTPIKITQFVKHPFHLPLHPIHLRVTKRYA